MRHCTCHKKLFLLTASRPNISVLFSRLSHKDGSVTREQFSAYIWSHYSYRHCTVTQHKDNSTSPFHPSWRKQLSLPHVQWHPPSYFRLLEVQGNRDWTGRTARLLEASGSKMELRNILKTLLRKVTEDQLQWPARTKADDAGGAGSDAGIGICMSGVQRRDSFMLSSPIQKHRTRINFTRPSLKIYFHIF